MSKRKPAPSPKPAPRPRGRPSLLTPETQQAICDGVQIGMPQRHAWLAAGITEACGQGWVEQGRKDLAAGIESRYAGFVVATEKARAAGVRANLATIRSAALGYPGADGRPTKPREWTAAAWILERTNAADFARRTQISGPEGGPIATQALLVEAAGAVPADEVAAMIAAGRAAMEAKKKNRKPSPEPETA
jgi:hypothetical protein